jgi:hypothetical protein
MKTLLCLLLTGSIVLLTFKLDAAPKKGPEMSHKYYYETDGHYWTVLIVATLLKVQHAKEIAYQAEYPDNVINPDGYLTRHRFTFMYPWRQKKLHALTGGDPKKELTVSINMFRNAKSAMDTGIAAHRLGDSYSHINDRKGKMYPHVVAHLFHWKRPDKIKSNPSKYLSYVNQLVKCMGGEDAEIDMTVFNYIANSGLTSEQNSAILKAEYNYLIEAPAFCAEKNEVATIQRYLKERFSSINKTFTTFSSTDHKGKVTTVIILNTPGIFATGPR